MARQHPLLDGTLVSDDTSFELTTWGGSVFLGSGASGTVANLIQVGDTISAVADLDIELASSVSQSGNTIQAQILMAGQPIPSIAYAITGYIVVDDGQRTFVSPTGELVVKTGAVIADRILAASWSQAADSVASEATIGATTAANGVVSYSQAANTLSAAADPLAGLVASWAQSSQTLSSASEVKRILLSATGTVEIGGTVSSTQDNNTISAVLNTGDNNIYILQADNTLVAAAFAGAGTTAQINAEGDTISATAATIPTATRWVALNFRRADGSLPPATTFKWAFWDDPTPDLLDVAVDRGEGYIRDDGSCTLIFEHSTLAANEVGYLVMSNTDGDPDTPWRHHSGPVRVS